MQQMHSWRPDPIAMRPPVTMRENCISIRINEIGRAERSQAGREFRQQLKTNFNRRRVPRLPPGTGKHLKQRAERILGIALSDRVVCAQAKQLSKTRAVEVAVVREDVHAAAQLARERLGVGKGAPTLRRPADVADHGTASVGMILSEAQAGAFARCERLLDKAHIAILVVGDSPTVFVWPVKAAVARELLQRCDDAEQRVQRRECHRSLRDSRQAGTLTPLQILLVLRGQAIAAGGDRLAEAGRVRRKLEDGRIACGARRLRDRGAARARRAGKFAAASRAPAG